MTIQDANSMLMGAGIPAARFETIGTHITGRIVDIGTAQQTDITTGEPQYWPSGDPKMQIIITLAGTNQQDHSDPEDSGDRKVYVKGKQLTDAVRNAIKASGAKGLALGGNLTVTHTGLGEPPSRGLNAPKLYAAAYLPPQPGAEANNLLMTTDTPAPAAAAAGNPVDTAKQLLAAGVPEHAVAAATGLPADVIAALAQL